MEATTVPEVTTGMEGTTGVTTAMEATTVADIMAVTIDDPRDIITSEPSSTIESGSTWWAPIQLRNAHPRVKCDMTLHSTLLDRT